MDQKNDFLERESISKLMRMYSVPCILSLLVAALYNIVDHLFIANASYLGSYGNAANTVVFPLTVVALAFAVMIGDGACAFISISLGQKCREDAKNCVGNAILLSVIIGVVIALLYLVFQNPILTMFGGNVNAQTFEHAKEYFFWITLGIPFYVFGQAMNPVIRSDGSPRFAMASTVIGAVVNIILDPILIFVVKWGMMGAAIATDLGQVVTAVLAIYYLKNMKEISVDRSCFGFRIPLIKSQISLVAAMAAINNMLRKYGAMDLIFGQEQYAQVPMAVVGIVMKFFQIVISIAVGMAAGCIPVVGYNIGAGRKDRVKSLFLLLLKYETILGAVALVIVEGFPHFLIRIFGASNESVYYTQFAVKSFRVYLCMVVLATVNKGTFIFLQSIGKAKESTILSMAREILFGVGFALVLPVFWGLDGVLVSMPVSDFLAAILSFYLIKKIMKELNE